ncbi:transcription termination factor NusA [Patescibacteria group bacterium]|nr:transcription termination factor NusA [Patescibacteria group bacterium]
MIDPSIKAAIKQICAEKGLSEESVLETINSALAAAYRKDFGDKMQNIQAEFELDKGTIKIFDVKEVVTDLSPEELAAMEEMRLKREAIKEALEKGEITPEELKKQRDEEEIKSAEAKEEKAEGEEAEEERHFNPKTEIQISDAKKIDEKYEIGDFVKTELAIPGEFGRMAAQTAKQVIIQRLREAERNIIYQSFKDKEGEILNGMVQKIEGRNIIIDLDNATAIMPPFEQIRRENYRIGDRIKILLVSVSLTTRGPELIVSRASTDFVKKLFTLEIPEISNNTIEIKEIAREAGSRTKLAVFTADENIDPIGSCIGQRGARIQTIIQELGGEKIDIIEYSEDPKKFITNSLLPAKITSVELNESDKTAEVSVPQDQLSLTIGRAGQNVRLASKITGWTIKIKEAAAEAQPETETTEKTEEQPAVEAEKPKAKKKSKKKETSDEAESTKTEPVAEKKSAKKKKSEKVEAEKKEEEPMKEAEQAAETSEEKIAE